jgi:hypothetical protein
MFFMFCSCFVVIVVLCIFIFVCTSVGLLPPGESPIAVVIIIIIVIIIITTTYGSTRTRKHDVLVKQLVLLEDDLPLGRNASEPHIK